MKTIGLLLQTSISFKQRSISRTLSDLSNYDIAYVCQRTPFYLVRCIQFDFHRNSDASEVVSLVDGHTTNTERSHGNGLTN